MDLRKIDRIPGVASVMTPFPHAVAPSDPITRAEALMEEHQIRHVPVCEGEDIVGLITHRDLVAVTNPATPKPDRARIRVSHVFMRDPFVVDLHAPIDEVVRQMAGRHIGSAIVAREGKLAGIFTAHDACVLLADILATRFRGDNGDAA